MRRNSLARLTQATVILLTMVSCTAPDHGPLPTHNSINDWMKHAVSFRVPNRFFPQKQRSFYSCWMTSAAMLVSWHEQRLVTTDHLSQNLDAHWKSLYDADKGLPRGQYEEFARDLGLTFEYPANYLPSAYSEFLQSYGPLWIAMGEISHARILIALEDGIDEVAMVFVDPATGKEERLRFNAFFKTFEEEARLLMEIRPTEDLPLQILHYPNQK